MGKNTGVKIHGFSLMKFVAGIFSWYLGQQCFYLTLSKYSWENVHGTLKNHENRGSLFSKSFPVYNVLNVCMHYHDVRLISVIFICLVIVKCVDSC